MCPEMEQIQKLIVEGRWADVCRYVEPLRASCADDFLQVEYTLRKQQYLEALCWQGALDCPPDLAPWRPLRVHHHHQQQGLEGEGEGAGEGDEAVDMDQVVLVLKSLESLCSQQEFNRLCNCLTYTNLAESPDFGQWRMAEGRLDCVRVLNSLLSPCLLPEQQGQEQGQGRPGQALRGALALGLEYCVEQAAAAAARGAGPRGRREFFEALPPRVPVRLQRQRSTPEGGEGRLAMRPEVPGALQLLQEVTEVLPSLVVVSRSASSSQSVSGPAARSFLTTGGGGAGGGGNATVPPPISKQAQQQVQPQHVQQQNMHKQQVQQQQMQQQNMHKQQVQQQQVQQQQVQPQQMQQQNMHKQQVQQQQVQQQQVQQQQVQQQQVQQQQVQQQQVQQQHVHAQQQQRSLSTQKPPPPVAWTVESSGDGSSASGAVLAGREKVQRGQSWNIDFEERGDISSSRGPGESGVAAAGSRAGARGGSPARPAARVDQPQHQRPIDNHNDDDATVMTTGTSMTSGTAMTTGTGLMSQDTMDRRGAGARGAGGELSHGGRAPRVQEAIPAPVRRQPPTPQSPASRARPSSAVFPGWANALAASDQQGGQAVVINPVLLFRDSNPLRSVSLRPSACSVVASRDEVDMDDSLTMNMQDMQLNPATTGEILTLAVGSNAKSVTVVDMSRPFNAISIRHELQGVHRGSIYSTDWSRDGALLASGSNDKTIRVIRNIPFAGQQSSGSGLDIACSSLKGHSGTIRCVKFCPFFGSSSPAVLASGGAGDCRLRVWDVQSEACTALAAHQDHIHGISWLNSDVVLSGCDKGALLAHDTRTASVAWSIQLSANGICHLGSLCDNLLFSGHTNGEVNIFDVRTRRKMSSHVLHGGDVRSVALWTQPPPSSAPQLDSASHLFALTTSFDGQGSVWRLSSQQGSSSSSGGLDVAKVARLAGHTDKILSAVYSPRTHDVVTSGADGNVLMWSGTNIATVD